MMADGWHRVLGQYREDLPDFDTPVLCRVEDGWVVLALTYEIATEDNPQEIYWYYPNTQFHDYAYDWCDVLSYHSFESEQELQTLVKKLEEDMIDEPFRDGAWR